MPTVTNVSYPGFIQFYFRNDYDSLFLLYVKGIATFGKQAYEIYYTDNLSLFASGEKEHQDISTFWTEVPENSVPLNFIVKCKQTPPSVTKAGAIPSYNPGITTNTPVSACNNTTPASNEKDDSTTIINKYLIKYGYPIIQNLCYTSDALKKITSLIINIDDRLNRYESHCKHVVSKGMIFGKRFCKICGEYLD